MPPWDATDSDGEGLRCAAVGQLTLVYLVNRTASQLHVIGIVWLG